MPQLKLVYFFEVDSAIMLNENENGVVIVKTYDKSAITLPISFYRSGENANIIVNTKGEVVMVSKAV